MEFVGGVVVIIIIGILIDMARGKKPRFMLWKGQKLKDWDEK